VKAIDPNPRLPDDWASSRRKLAELFRDFADRFRFTYDGTWTPTLTNTNNITTSAASVCQYTRSGYVVTCSGRVTLTPTAGAAATYLEMSLPVASNFSSVVHARGTATRFITGVAQLSAAVVADTSNKTLAIQYHNDASTASAAFSFICQYRVIP
jgi:uncharacterized protein YfcZ (UPF0381/DUF406 family)